MTQGHNLQGVCCLSARLGAGPSLPHRSPQQLPQPRGLWPLLHEGRYIWGNLYRNKFIRIIGGPGLEPLSPSLWEHSGAGGTQPAEVIHVRQTFIVLSSMYKLIALSGQNVLHNVLSECVWRSVLSYECVSGSAGPGMGHSVWPLTTWPGIITLEEALVTGTGQWLTHCTGQSGHTRQQILRERLTH